MKNNTSKELHLDAANQLAKAANQDGLISLLDNEYTYVSEYFAEHGVTDINALLKITYHLEQADKKYPLTRLLLLTGIYYYAIDMDSPAEEKLVHALKITEDLGGNDGEIHTYLGNVAVNKSMYKQAIMNYEAAKNAFISFGDLEKAVRAGRCVANCLWHSGELEKALFEFSDLLEIYHREEWNPADIIYSMARVKLEASCFAEAMQYLETAEEISIRSNTLEDKVRVAQIYYHMGVCLRKIEYRSLSAEDILRMALTMYRVLNLDATNVYYELAKLFECSDITQAYKFTRWYLIRKIPIVNN